MSAEVYKTSPEEKRQLVVVRHSPYGSSMARSSLDTVLAFAAFDQPVNVLFLGEGVLQLISAQDGKSIDGKTLAKQIGSLPLYGVETFYADEDALNRFSLTVDELLPQVRRVDKAKIRELIAAHDHVLSF